MVIFLGLNVFHFDTEVSFEDCEIIDTEWYLLEKNGSKTLVDVPYTQEMERGKTCYFITTLPENLRDDTVLMFNAVKQDYFAVFIDKEQVATYYDAKDFVYRINCGDMYLTVPVNSDDSGKVLEVAMSSRTKYSGNLRETYYGKPIDVFIYIAQQTIMADIGALSIFIAASIALVMCFILRVIYKTNTSFVYLALFVLIVCAWIITSSNVRQYFFGNNVLIMDVAYWTLYSCPIPLLIYINDIQKNRHKKLYMVAISVCIAVFVLTNLTCIFFNIDYSDMIRIVWAPIGFGGGAILHSVFWDKRKHLLKEYWIVALGFVGVIFTGATQLVSYELNKDATTTAWLALGLGFLLVTAGTQALVDFVKSVNEKSILRDTLEKNSRKIEKLSEQALFTLSQTVDAKDKYTNGHSRRVADYSMLLAKKIGMDNEYQSTIYYTALLHDIGKIGIADSILNKQGGLDDEEYDTIKSHTTIGFDILKQMTEIPQIEFGAKWHHERYDGKGYPDGLIGEHIPLNARIIAVADAYDAMTSSRVYRKELSKDYVRTEIENGIGTQFDPEIARKLLELFDGVELFEIKNRLMI